MSKVEEESKTIVLDNGSGQIKAGFAGEESPRCVFSNVVGRPKYSNQMIGMGKKDIYIGDEAQAKKGILKLEYPLSEGIVRNWDYMAKVIGHTFSTELRVDPSEYALLMTEAPMNPTDHKVKMGEIVFEQFHVKSFISIVQAILALYASGRTTGLVLDSGDGVTHTVPVYEGYALTHGISRIDIAGRNVTSALYEGMKLAGARLSTSADFESVRVIKEKKAYVAYDYEEELAKNATTEVEMSDGERIMLTDQLFNCAEPLFNPSMIGMEAEGVQYAVHKSVMSCDRDLRKALLSNILLSGGTTTLKGFPDRLHKELTNMVGSDIIVEILAPLNREFSVFFGGSVFGALSTFQEVSVSREEYNEKGKGVISTKIK